ncbi:MBL fold metallo-hydrolase [Pseudoalteromonas sp. H105]|uniref:MBL fold metallo-hydrolase n=1 Tax=Pseudoalteromonas sp. H105 TaxID=1348393 RepID=UPI00073233FA|nr:MBL fold metallo-hydrolase [Pseudoalteromonas sp. H105]KTF13652.1 hypothetical protein ATS75_13835 [Pseudoalteromonas sp. H105]
MNIIRKNLATYACNVALILITFCSSIVAADEKENQIINHAVKAYGGDKLKQLNSLTFSGNMNQFSQWQSGHALQGPMVSYLNDVRFEYSIDLLNKRKAYKEAVTTISGGHGSNIPSVTHRLFLDGKGYSIDHALQMYQASDRISFDNTDLGTHRLLDTLIIKQLSEERHASQWIDMAYIEGQANDVLSINAGTESEYYVYINKRNGYLSRVLRKRGGDMITYDFLAHQQADGFTWAQRLFVGTAEKVIYHSDDRYVRFNSAQDGDFQLPPQYSLRAQLYPVDVSEMIVKKLASGVYFVGQGWAYTLFIDVGEYYISAGAWQVSPEDKNWQAGLKLLHEETGTVKPVKQHIVTHHHNDHMMGLQDVVDQGASLIVHAADIPSVQAHLSAPLPRERLFAISNTKNIANGNILLFDVPNSHANHNLAVYLPKHKILFTEDMFGSSFETAFNSPSTWPSGDTYHRLEVLIDHTRKLKLEVNQYVSSHHARVLNQKDIDKARAIARPNKTQLMQRLFSQKRDEAFSVEK